MLHAELPPLTLVFSQRYQREKKLCNIQNMSNGMAMNDLACTYRSCDYDIHA